LASWPAASGTHARKLATEPRYDFIEDTADGEATGALRDRETLGDFLDCAIYRHSVAARNTSTGMNTGTGGTGPAECRAYAPVGHQSREPCEAGQHEKLGFVRSSVNATRLAARQGDSIPCPTQEKHRLTWAKSEPAKDKRLSREAWLDKHHFSYWYPLMLIEWGYDRETSQAHVGQRSG
jgi:hypothetical protein